MEFREGFEDISSNSRKDEFVDISSVSRNYTSKHYKKKKRGIAGFFANLGEKISNWWRKASRSQKAAVVSLSSVIAVLLAGIIFLTTFFNYNYNRITDNPDDLGFSEVIDKEIVNIALFGIDSRNKNFRGNSDSIMILSLNKDKKQVKIVSIMRDSLVKINYKGKLRHGKINSAYALGGPELAIKTINENFSLDISEYATVNFEGMMDIIDAVGGIEAELTSKEVVSASSNLYALNGTINDMCGRLKLDPKKYYVTTPGVHHLNGVQAVAYSRIRKVTNIWGTTNDQGRTDRQRYVMEQLFNKALRLNKSNYIKLAKALIPCSETSLSLGDIVELATSILLKNPTFSQSRVPLDEYQITSGVPQGYGSIVYYDLDFASTLLYEFFYKDTTPEDYISENGVEKNSWYKSSQGSSANTSRPNVSNPSASSNITSSQEENESQEQSSDQHSSSSVISSSSSSKISSSDTSSEEDSSEISSSSEEKTSSNTSSTVTSSDLETEDEE